MHWRAWRDSYPCTLGKALGRQTISNKLSKWVYYNICYGQKNRARIQGLGVLRQSVQALEAQISFDQTWWRGRVSPVGSREEECSESGRGNGESSGRSAWGQQKSRWLEHSERKGAGGLCRRMAKWPSKLLSSLQISFLSFFFFSQRRKHFPLLLYCKRREGGFWGALPWLQTWHQSSPTWHMVMENSQSQEHSTRAKHTSILEQRLKADPRRKNKHQWRWGEVWDSTETLSTTVCKKGFLSERAAQQ